MNFVLKKSMQVIVQVAQYSTSYKLDWVKASQCHPCHQGTRSAVLLVWIESRSSHSGAVLPLSKYW